MKRISRTVRTLPLWCALFALTPITAELRAQCDPSLRAVGESTGYRKRAYGCEGLYVGLQSAPLAVQVVSLTKGSLHHEARGAELRVVPPPGLDLTNLMSGIQVIGRARAPNLNWALHGITTRDREMRWNLNEVVIPAALELRRLGVHGQTGRRSGVGPPVYVPLAFVPTGQNVQTTDSLELVLRVLEAAEVCVTHGTTRICPRGVDSYFTFRLPAGSSGETVLQVRWRRFRQPAFGEPELIRIYQW